MACSELCSTWIKITDYDQEAQKTICQKTVAIKTSITAINNDGRYTVDFIHRYRLVKNKLVQMFKLFLILLFFYVLLVLN